MCYEEDIGCTIVRALEPKKKKTIAIVFRVILF